jgi:hypothetical protein
MRAQQLHVGLTRARLAKEIVNLQPDVILAATVTAAVAFRQHTLTPDHLHAGC